MCVFNGMPFQIYEKSLKYIDMSVKIHAQQETNISETTEIRQNKNILQIHLFYYFIYFISCALSILVSLLHIFAKEW